MKTRSRLALASLLALVALGGCRKNTLKTEPRLGRMAAARGGGPPGAMAMPPGGSWSWPPSQQGGVGLETGRDPTLGIDSGGNPADNQFTAFLARQRARQAHPRGAVQGGGPGTRRR
jgi:hypothetical protein